MRVISMVLAALWWVAAAGAEERLPILHATRAVVSIRLGDALYKDAWQLAPEAKPDIYEAELTDGRPQRVAFITDVDSIGFTVETDGQYDFIIQHGDDRCLTRIVGVRVPPAAVFDAEYRTAHQGKISVEVPEAYELVNVAIAMTPTGLADRNLVYHDSGYYTAMRKWFDPFRDHPVLAALDSVLRQRPFLYSNLKMNGYSFEFDPDGRIVQSRIYDRTAFPSEHRNSLRPFLAGLQSFSDRSKFRTFYKSHRRTYAAQVAFYTDSADVDAMRAWLGRNFPGSKGYDSYKIVFSPLVAYNQSATWLESGGFRELQAHVNYPYPQDVKRRTGGADLSERAKAVLRGDIVFTELNHGYINPEADKYADRVVRAISRRDLWVDPEKGPNYYGGISAFNEYMNWGLVSLRVVDLVPGKEQQTLIKVVDDMMTQGRGFPEFAAFGAFLVDLYCHRETGQTVSDLYPQIIDWFERRNATAPGETAPH
jgi:Domain of unknown function (DUF4932)